MQASKIEPGETYAIYVNRLNAYADPMWYAKLQTEMIRFWKEGKN